MRTPAMKRPLLVYQLTNCLGEGRRIRVTGDEIAPTVSAWLAELGATSPLVEDLAAAVSAADWPKTRALSEFLSVEVAVAGRCPKQGT
ncbi:MAG: hypothetical protein JO044_07210 [Mycobacteriaceae bacterium]|nr:hypothetical protein [Mycobacteriaceae bacterium]